jgi:hypothetical protein
LKGIFGKKSLKMSKTTELLLAESKMAEDTLMNDSNYDLNKNQTTICNVSNDSEVIIYLFKTQLFT